MCYNIDRQELKACDFFLTILQNDLFSISDDHESFPRPDPEAQHRRASRNRSHLLKHQRNRRTHSYSYWVRSTLQYMTQNFIFANMFNGKCN